MTTTQPDSMTKDEGLRAALAAAYEQGATDVHHEWKRAWYQGEGPPRGDPEFYEAASDYAASVDLPTPAEAEPVAGDALDWLKVAKLAGEHGIRYRTNHALEQFLAALSPKPTPVEAGAPRPGRDVIAYSIIEGSAGIRAAEHAKDFQTANWTDALRSADAVIAALSQPGSSESGGFEREIETSDGRLVTVRVALRQAAEAYAIARGNGHHGPGYNPVDVLRRAFLPSTPSSKER